MKLIDSLGGGRFCIVVECSPHHAADVRKVAAIGKALPALNEKFQPHGIVFPAVTLTQSPGGSLTFDHQAALGILREEGWPAEIEIIPHITGKDMNLNGLVALLSSFAECGVETVLALTGDKPEAKGVFELDSLGLLQLLTTINAGLLRTASDPEAFAAVPLLRAGAAVSPYKYTEGSLAMQYIKAAKKVREGAAFLVCQAGWDAERAERLVEELAGEGIPLLGNVLVLGLVAARAMRELPGCVITDALLDKLQGESEEDNLARAAQQLAMFRRLGYAGVDLGRPGDFPSAAMIDEIVERSLAVEDWTVHRANLTFAPPERPPPKIKGSARVSWAVHRAVFDDDGALHGVTRALLKPFNTSAAREGVLYRLFKAMEDSGKGAVYTCEHCGDCFLPENEYVCTMGQCEKGLSNVPCGDADPEGRCGNNPERFCAGEIMYHRMLRREALEDFKQRAVLPSRRPALANTSSVLNRFFGRDHLAHPNPLAGSGLIQIAELIHASVPYAGTALRYIQQCGEHGFTRHNRGLLAIEELIRTQAGEGADYIDLNIDALGAADVPDRMRRLVRLVHRNGLGVPPCIDSSDPAVLEAGLDAWLSIDAPTRPPLVNSVTFSEPERYAGVLALRARKPFSVIGLLVGREGPLKTADEMVAAARALFERFRASGFAPGEIFFDTVTLGIGTDGFMDPMGALKPSHTREAFHAIRSITNDAAMKGVHAVLGVSNWVYGARRRRIGHLRAFIAVAMEFGLDAAIVDTSKAFGIKPPPPELVEFVRMFESLDGSEESMDRYTETMARAREAAWV